jgi:predicted nucleic-acid-binding protein
VRIIDANVILRYLTNDVQDQAEQAGEQVVMLVPSLNMCQELHSCL